MTGLPCSGKSTIARKLREYLPDLEILDGDDLNKWLKPDGWSRESRIINNKRIAHIAKLLLKHNISVWVSVVSPYSEGRKAAREIVNDKSELVNTIEEINAKKYTTMDSLKVNFEILQQINLPDFFKEHSLIVAKYLG